MKRSIILLLVLTVALALAAVPVSAGPKIEASGTWDYSLTGPPEVRVAGPNVFIYGQDRGEWGGTFEGYTEEEFVVVCHPKAGFSFYKGEMTFYGTVEDESGISARGHHGHQDQRQAWTQIPGCDPVLRNGKATG